MGLDQYAFAVRPHPNNTPFSIWWHTEEGEAERVAIENTGQSVVQRIAQWRKHSDLQGWMEALWLRKHDELGVEPPRATSGWNAGEVTFNCQPVQVTFQDLADLEAAVDGNELPHTTGFFFGASQPEDADDDREFIAKAREFIGGDFQIYYDSWW